MEPLTFPFAGKQSTAISPRLRLPKETASVTVDALSAHRADISFVAGNAPSISPRQVHGLLDPMLTPLPTGVAKTEVCNRIASVGANTFVAGGFRPAFESLGQYSFSLVAA